MEACLSLYNAETPYAGFRTSPLSISSRRIKSVASPVRFFCQRRGVVCPISCERGERGAFSVVEKSKTVHQSPNGSVGQLSCVMKFGGSSVASAERMREVAELIPSFPEEGPVIVPSAMGKTTNKLLQAGEKAVSCGVSNVSNIDELRSIKELHLKTVDELGVDRSTISPLLDELEQFIKEIAVMKEMTLHARDYLVSFGECMSTRIFAAYLNKIGAMMKDLTRRTKDYLVSFGVCMSTRIFGAYLNKIGAKAGQYDAFDIGFITTDAFTNADILEATYPAVAKRLHGDWINDPAISVVTGFLRKGWKTCAVTTLGRGGSDLTATTIGKALGLREIQEVHVKQQWGKGRPLLPTCRTQMQLRAGWPLLPMCWTQMQLRAGRPLLPTCRTQMQLRAGRPLLPTCWTQMQLRTDQPLLPTCQTHATPSGSASTSHVPDLNATPKGSASASNMPDPNTALFNLFVKWDPRKIHALFDSKNVKALLGIYACTIVTIAFSLVLLAFLRKF